MRIAVAGGTGVVGRHVVRAAEAAGHEVAVLSRARGVDLGTGRGLGEALTGAEVIVDTSNAAVLSRAKATDFFVGATERLHRAGAEQGVQRLVTLSIVGIDQVRTYGYYAAKLAQEEAARRGPLPAAIVRATQFHEFPAQILARTRLGPVAVVPSMPTQPVAARSVGEFLVEVAVAPPVGEDLVEVAGPRPEEVVRMARELVRRRGRRIAVLPLPVPGRNGRAFRERRHLPGEGARLIGPTFDAWLATEDAAGVHL